MLIAARKGWTSPDYSLLRPTGEVVGELLFSRRREEGSFVLSGGSYGIQRSSVFGPFVLVAPGGARMGQADLSAFGARFTITHEGRQYVLKNPSIFGHARVLYDEARELGRIAPASWTGQRATCDFPDDVPLPLQAFAAWLTLLLWRRSSDAVPAGVDS